MNRKLVSNALRDLSLLFVLVVLASSSLASVTMTGDALPAGAATQPDPWAVGGSLKVGNSSHGTLNVKAGGMVSNSTGRIGNQAGSTGVVTVSGASSQWNNSDRLVVGRSGDGTLIVEAL